VRSGALQLATPSLSTAQADTSGRLAKAEEERQFLKQLNDTLLANQKDFQVGCHSCSRGALPCQGCIVGRPLVQPPLQGLILPGLGASRCLPPCPAASWCR
jgi:hypothetical protein